MSLVRKVQVICYIDHPPVAGSKPFKNLLKPNYLNEMARAYTDLIEEFSFQFSLGNIEIAFNILDTKQTLVMVDEINDALGKNLMLPPPPDKPLQKVRKNIQSLGSVFGIQDFIGEGLHDADLTPVEHNIREVRRIEPEKFIGCVRVKEYSDTGERAEAFV